jgi:hypothetical protein
VVNGRLIAVVMQAEIIAARLDVAEFVGAAFGPGEFGNCQIIDIGRSFCNFRLGSW